MDQQDELQAAINNITNGDSGAAGGSDVVSEIENKVAGGVKTDAAATLGEMAIPAAPEMPKNESPAPASADISGFGAMGASNFGAENVNEMAAPSISGFGASANKAVDASANSPKIEITPQKAMYGDPDLDRVKSNALNEIRPILETVDIPFEKKFMIYKDIIELTDDKSCIEPAYNCARQIVDEKTRAESLLYIIEIIDDLGVKVPKA